MNYTVSVLISLGTAFIVTALLGIVLIPLLHKLKFGQNILTDIGPRWHAKKQGTPTMGGIMFIIGIFVAVAVTFLTGKLTGFSLFSENDVISSQEKTKLLAGLLLALCMALVGFTDDYIKVSKKRNLGLTEMQKTVLQVIIIAAYLTTMVMSKNTSMFIPLIGKISLDSLPGIIFFYLFGACVIYGTANAVNFTDGIDGLCGSVTVPVGVAFAVIAYLVNNTSCSVLAAALAGACAGYLIWNHYPAKVMMGDTGSMFLGGLVAALAFSVNCPLILIPVGIVYVIEALSDILQIGSIKLRHKKIFKMSPIHHHFEMSGWSEKKIVAVFSVVSFAGAIAGVILMCFTVN
ncbi:MAG: phospho-N-acetylmuramoyl-pentapeptide-transferase [Oscillospiraceae bacterium]|nr:phospho-N-acetylmuramoyl-pentapeptide-transferase [Oscillospiraceae bacterium]MDD7292017.1 phospho-N-acetylmuramoyl-pentapeptide-transferase [Clostridiaceae bacterium]MDY5991119.1 phospho-N-acetylmuramoyl-pentapeptide-transferase [Oscillospiraceae bacterium]